MRDKKKHRKRCFRIAVCEFSVFFGKNIMKEPCTNYKNILLSAKDNPLPPTH